MADLSSRSPQTTDIDIVSVSTDQPSYIDWSAVFAGTAIASAMSLLLYGFGASVGLYVAQPWATSAETTAGISIAVIVFVALAYIYSLALGSYFTGRMRPRYALDLDECRFRDGANGLVVWAVALVIGAFLASNVVVGATDRLASVGYRTAAGVSSALAPFAERTADTLLRGAEYRSTTAGRGAGPDDAEAAAPASPAAPDGAAAPDEAPATDGAASPQGTGTTAQPAARSTPGAAGSEVRFSLNEQQREQILRIIARALSEGELAEQDKQYLARVLETQFGYTPDAALQTVNREMDSALAQSKAYLEEAKANTAFAGFWTAVVVLLAGLASWWAAALGGSHRDEAEIAAERDYRS